MKQLNDMSPVDMDIPFLEDAADAGNPHAQSAVRCHELANEASDERQAQALRGCACMNHERWNTAKGYLFLRSQGGGMLSGERP